MLYIRVIIYQFDDFQAKNSPLKNNRESLEIQIDMI
jgi:hypothetical protein